jgi:hypothetical protein
VIAAIDQDVADAGGAHFAEGDFRRAGHPTPDSDCIDRNPSFNWRTTCPPPLSQLESPHQDSIIHIKHDDESHDHPRDGNRLRHQEVQPVLYVALV